MTNSALSRHGIDHLSPSSINAWIASPGIWALRYLANVRDETNAAMSRGTAVEAGMLYWLQGQRNVTAAEAVAIKTFDEKMQGEISDEIDVEKELIKGMVRQVQTWQPPSELLAAQIKIEHWFEGVSVPVIGYLDFSFDGVDVDLKTTKQCPSEPKPDHIRQIALYRAARNRPGALLYVTAKKHAYYPVDDARMDEGLAELQSAAQSLERFLSRFNDAEDAIRCLPIDRDSFRFSNAAKEKLLEMHL